MRITIELRRPARRSVVVLFGLLVLAAPGVVLANHVFSDVPTSNPFHTQIGAIAKAGITGGFGDGTYHPTEPVTRQAMAAFMQRGFGRVGLADNTGLLSANVEAPSGFTSSPYYPVRYITISVPGTSNAFSPNQLVYVHGHVTFLAYMTTQFNGCPCEFAARIKDQDGAIHGTQNETFWSGTAVVAYHYGVDVEALFEVGPGLRTYYLEVALANRADDPEDLYALDQRSSLVAMTFPFGPMGTNDQ
jgi:hypothetical protein